MSQSVIIILLEKEKSSATSSGSREKKSCPYRSMIVSELADKSEHNSSEII